MYAYKNYIKNCTDINTLMNLNYKIAWLQYKEDFL